MNAVRLASNLAAIREKIAAAATRAGRPPESVRLIAVTKKSPVEWLPPLLDLGVNDLGENYPQELWRKAEFLRDQPVRWHLIGHLQTNKARRTYPLVHAIHSVDSVKLLDVLHPLASEPEPLIPFPDVYLQVNASREATKYGFEADQLRFVASSLAATYPHLPIVGLMTMAPFVDDPEDARSAFRQLSVVRDQIRAETGLPLPELSMGMSHDFEVAIEEGATAVRIGSALFEGVQS